MFVFKYCKTDGSKLPVPEQQIPIQYIFADYRYIDKCVSLVDKLMACNIIRTALELYKYISW